MNRALESIWTLNDVMERVDLVPMLREDPEGGGGLAAAVGAISHPDVETQMLLPGGDVNTRGSGVAGFLSVWTDWIASFEHFRLEQAAEPVAKDDAAVTFVTQRGTLPGSDAELTSSAAAAWFFRDGLLERMEFHLDPEEACHSAGLEPPEDARRASGVLASVRKVLDAMDYVDIAEVLRDDPEGGGALGATLREICHPDLETVVVLPEEEIGAEGRGVTQFLTLWSEWTAAFESFELAQAAAPVVRGESAVNFVRQRGTLQGSPGAVRATGAAAWLFREGRLARIEFHVDPDEARRVAGIDPDG